MHVARQDKGPGTYFFALRAQDMEPNTYFVSRRAQHNQKNWVKIGLKQVFAYFGFWLFRGVRNIPKFCYWVLLVAIL